MPEPQADYFEHPAVRKSSFLPNNPNQSFMNANNRGINSGAGQGFGDIGGFMTPNPLLLPPISNGGIGGQ